MKKYLLLLHEDIDKMQKLSPKEMEELANSHMVYSKKIIRKLKKIGSCLTEKLSLIFTIGAIEDRSMQL